MGYAGNKEPQFIIPSAIAVKETAKVNILRVNYLFLVNNHPRFRIRTS